MQTCFPRLFALDQQEPDNVIVARRCSGKALEKASRGDIIGFAGDTVREPPLYTVYPGPCPQLFPSHCTLSSAIRDVILSLSPHLFCINPRSPCVQNGEIQASNKLGAYTVPTTFLNNTVEAKAEAKKMGAETATQAAKEQAKKAEKKPVQAATKPATATQADTKQKIKKQAVTGKQKMAAAPAKEGAPVKRCTVSFTGACVVLVSAAVFFATTMALRSNSSMSTGAAEVVTTKSVSNWADQQCEMHDNDNGVRNNFTAVQETFETTCSVRLDFPPS